MKKILITLSVTILCLGLSACGNKETDKSKNQVTVSSSKETEKNQGRMGHAAPLPPAEPGETITSTLPISQSQAAQA